MDSDDDKAGLSGGVAIGPMGPTRQIAEKNEAEAPEITAALLLSVSEGETLRTLDQEESRTLLGNMRVNRGSTSFEILVPVLAVQAAGLNQALWQQAGFRRIRRDGQVHYVVPAKFAPEMVRALEARSRTTHLAAQRFVDRNSNYMHR